MKARFCACYPCRGIRSGGLIVGKGTENTDKMGEGGGTAPRQVEDRQTGKNNWTAFTGNPLAVALVAAVVAGVVSLGVNHFQNQDTARQAVSSQQTQELLQMQKTADTIDQDAQNVAIYAFRCSFKGKKWATCIFDAPDYFKLEADSDTLGTISDSTSDQQADSLALKLSTETEALMSSTSFDAGIKALGGVTNAQLDLDSRCGLLIQGYP
jgi:Tfp pilus assembly protein PilV